MSEHIRTTAAPAQTNLHAVLQLVAAGRLRCSQTTRRPAATSVAAVAEVLDGADFYSGEPIAAFAWPLLLQAGGLAELAGGRLQLTDRGRAALAKPAAATIRQLWRSWVTTTVLDEFNRVDEIKGQRAANVLTSVKTRRKAVATALARCPRDEWTAIDDLFNTMRRTRETSPTIARSERGLWKLYLVDPQYGSLGYSGFADWPILEGRYTLAVLFEYAATLGLIDIEYTDPVGARTDYHGNWGADDLDCLSRYDGLLAVRLNRSAPMHSARTTKIRDRGVLRLLECADAPLATLIARDPKLRSLCTLVGDRHLAVPIEHETQFRHALRGLGHTTTAATG
jgi:hypothetical protein